MAAVVLSLMHYSWSINPLKTGLCKEKSLFKNQGVFNKRRWPHSADGPTLGRGEAMGRGPLFACALPQPRASVTHISCLSRLIDSLQKGKLILGQHDIKPPEEELNISEKHRIKNGNCYFRFFENLSRRAKNRKWLILGTTDLSSLL